jgi:hypothetical protein
MIGKHKFCRRYVNLNRQPISFEGRPYLREIYNVQRGNLVICASRQVEKSTFLANTVIFEAFMNPAAQILFVCPREEQARAFSHLRLAAALQQSPVLRRMLLGKGSRVQVNNLALSNGARVFIRAAYHSADACRGISADLLLVDEFQDVAAGDLPVLQETLSHAKDDRMILSGTPKTVDNHLQAVFRSSTACEWTLTCAACGNETTLDERCLGSVGIICPTCQASLDASQGRWVPHNLGATWGQGFRICHPMVPWLNFDGILERQRSYDPVRFRNEVMGLPTVLGDHVVTLQELEECCADRGMARTLEMIPRNAHVPLIAGVDWGGGVHSRTVLVIGRMRSDYVFEVLFFEAFQAREDPNRVITEIAKRCRLFQVAGIAADGGGNGHVYNRILSAHLQPRFGFYAILYSTVDQEPFPDGILTKWVVGRSATIGVLFTRVKQKRISFPRKQEVGHFLDEFACEVAVYDDAKRAIVYTHAETQHDDALHATNYALLLATRAHTAARQYGDADQEYG